MILLNAPKGLGDAIYLRSAALMLLDRGEQLTVYTRWPEVFVGLDVNIRTLADIEEPQDALRSVAYSARLPLNGMSMFAARCHNAEIDPPFSMRLDWKVQNRALVNRVRKLAAGRKILVYQPQRVALNPAMELLRVSPDAYRARIQSYRKYFRVKVGRTPMVEVGNDMPCELDLVDKTQVSDVIDVCAQADILVSTLSFITHVAETMDKRFVCMFSRRASTSDEWVRNIGPSYFHKPHLAESVYDA